MKTLAGGEDIQQPDQAILSSSYNLLLLPPHFYGLGSTLQRFLYSDVHFSASSDSAQVEKALRMN